jgi:1-acyl-sn-glycerol-3-phosphate acyltransferase
VAVAVVAPPRTLVGHRVTYPSVETAKRRLTSVPLLLIAATALVALLPVWLPIAVFVDLVRGRLRMPTARLLAFALGWSWLELTGVIVALWLWSTGRRNDHPRHYALQRWWAANLMRVLRRTTGLTVEVTGIEAMSPGPVVMLCRHASLADSLVSAWVVTSLATKRPRYVLKRELLADPCLDIVGNRLPNHFLDRDAADSASELAALTVVANGLGIDDVAIIFPEGTRAAPAKRTRALARIAERDPVRAERLAALQHLLPPRPAGTAALLAGSPGSDVVIAWHTGFEGLDTFGGILRSLGRGAPRVRFAAIRIPRDHVPSTDDVPALTAWLDERWLDADRAVDALLTESTFSRV